MNLVDNPWIPVIDQAGQKAKINLLELFINGKNYADFAVRPHERVALMRFFICIAQAALDGPEDDDEIADVSDNLPEAARKYLKKWKDSFDLFHKEKPFLQVAELVSDGEKTPVSKLDFSLSCGNNSTLFDQKGNDSNKRFLSDAELTIGLLTFLNFNSGGLLSVVSWGTKKSPKAGNPDSPCLKGSPYHTFLRGNNVFKSICLNIISKDTIESSIVSSEVDGFYMGVPIWEKFPRNENDIDAIKNATETYLGRLVPLSRWIKLDENKAEMIWGGGFAYKVFPDFCVPESSISTRTYMDNKKEVRAVVGASHSKAIWRDLASLIVSRDINNIGAPLVFHNIDEHDFYDIHVCALIRNQAVIEAAHDSVFSLSPKIRSNSGYNLYKKEIAYLNGVNISIGKAVDMYRKNIDESWEQRVRQAGKDKNKLLEKLRFSATNYYWTNIEQELPFLMSIVNALGDAEKVNKLRSAWRKKIYQISLASYSVACGRDTPRQIRAFALGLKELRANNKGVQKQEQEKESV